MMFPNLKYGTIHMAGSRNNLHRLSAIITSSKRLILQFAFDWIEGLSDLESSRPYTILSARRVNVGNMGRDAMVTMEWPENSHIDPEDVERFVVAACDVTDTTPGDLRLEPTLPGPPAMQSAQCPSPSAGSPTNWLGHVFPKKKHGRVSEDYAIEPHAGSGKPIIHEDLQTDEMPSPNWAKNGFEELADEEEQAIVTCEREQHEALEAIQNAILNYVTTYHADPTELMQTLLQGKMVVGRQQQFSPLVVNGDLKIVLPDYNEVEVKMPAMCRTIYILFLCHPEGIALRNIGAYRNELLNIYSLVMPGRNDAKAQQTIDNLCDPMNDTLNQYISKIKRCFALTIIDNEVASKYCISGQRGEPYKIGLDPSLITLPAAITLK